MTDDTPDTLLGAIVQLVVGLAGMALAFALMGGLLVLLAALLGAAFHIFFGSAPGILEPFGGTLAGLLAALVKLLANVMMVVIAIVMIWLMATGQMDEMMEDMFGEQQSQGTHHYEGKRRQNSTQSGGKRRRKSGGSDASLTGGSSHATARETELPGDTEFDEYGQIREK